MRAGCNHGAVYPERSAQGDHFGWHPQTGPDVHERVGHVVEANVLAADASVTGPLLRVEQSPATCGQVTAPMVQRLDRNLYLRAGADAPLVNWAPVAGTPCQATFTSLAALRAAVPAAEAHGSSRLGVPGALFSTADNLISVPSPADPLERVDAAIAALDAIIPPAAVA